MVQPYKLFASQYLRYDFLLATEMRKTEKLMNKLIYVGLSILDLSSTVILVWFVIPKFGENAKLFYMDTNSFIVPVKTDDIYKYIAEDVETRFGFSNLEIYRPVTQGYNQEVVGLIKDELGAEIMKEFLELRVKTYIYLEKNSLIFITPFYFSVPKNVRLNSKHYFVMKIPNKRKLAFNHSSDIDFQDCMYLL